MRQGRPRIVTKATLQNKDGEIVLSGELPPPYKIDLEYPDCRIVYVQEMQEPELDKETIDMINYYDSPASFNVIHNHLIRLAAEKKIIGSEKEIEYVLKDRVNRLKGATEIQVFNAVEWFIEYYESDFFPNTAKLKKKVFE